jgi:hypothetical protein
MAASMKITVFWDVAPCSLVKIDRRFRGAYCLHFRSHRSDGEDRYLHVHESYGRIWNDVVVAYLKVLFSHSPGSIITLFSDAVSITCSDYGGRTDVSLGCGRFYGPIVRPRMRMSEGSNE